MASSDPSIVLYTAQTPNGIKISITLEELGWVMLPYSHERSLLLQRALQGRKD
jgi:glutathione S-transferase